MAALWIRPALAGTALAAFATGALALDLDLPGEAQRETIGYACSDEVRRTAEYINIGDNSLALLNPGDGARLFVNVVAASGAKYVSGSSVWWTKGAEATLEDETAGTQAVTCRESAS
ncbi:MliC family protein [Aureimonas populi]|uniref:MliC family protein n=1 Tax=Aureimonas populi TaxID=1701758 RepID=A0ABW5CMI9_9HYPH|nr:MliC family protein [Aureimonas populi]